MEKRIAAYLFLFIAGITTEALAYLLVEGTSGVLGHFYSVRWDNLAIDLLPGIAAVLAAGALHTRFVRAARGRRRPQLYGWALLGVALSHAIYGVLAAVLLTVVGQTNAGALPLNNAIEAAVLFGTFSAMLGFIPNLLFATGFAEAVLWLDKNWPAPSMQPRA